MISQILVLRKKENFQGSVRVMCQVFLVDPPHPPFTIFPRIVYHKPLTLKRDVLLKRCLTSFHIDFFFLL